MPANELHDAFNQAQARAVNRAAIGVVHRAREKLEALEAAFAQIEGPGRTRGTNPRRDAQSDAEEAEAAGLITYATRASFIAAGDRISLPPRVEQALKYVGPASFAAIAAPAVLGGDQFAEFGDDIPRLFAMVVAGAVIWRTRNVPASLVTGMGTLWLLLWLLLPWLLLHHFHIIDILINDVMMDGNIIVLLFFDHRVPLFRNIVCRHAVG